MGSFLNYVTFYIKINIDCNKNYVKSLAKREKFEKPIFCDVIYERAFFF